MTRLYFVHLLSRKKTLFKKLIEAQVIAHGVNCTRHKDEGGPSVAWVTFMTESWHCYSHKMARSCGGIYIGNISYIYIYKKVSNLVMKNNPNTNKLQRTNILYKYECNVGDCEPQAYIGYTRTALSCRITLHLQSGPLLKHSQDFHNSTLNK